MLHICTLLSHMEKTNINNDIKFQTNGWELMIPFITLLLKKGHCLEMSMEDQQPTFMKLIKHTNYQIACKNVLQVKLQHE